MKEETWEEIAICAIEIGIIIAMVIVFLLFVKAFMPFHL